ELDRYAGLVAQDVPGLWYNTLARSNLWVPACLDIDNSNVQPLRMGGVEAEWYWMEWHGLENLQ
ncbi:MAG: hypothetical protein ACKPKO_52890, partial [Candidatus Fonsibacter sp.]